MTPTTPTTAASLLRSRLILGDALDGLRALPDGLARTCVTSPPYYGLRDYGHEDQIGHEDTPEDYVTRLLSVFREVWRVLADDGTLWVVIGDSYARPAAKGGSGPGGKNRATLGDGYPGGAGVPDGLKPKDLVGVPWMFAFRMRAHGWYLRQDVIWHKPNPMPESVRDRCTRAHEYVFMFSKRERYFYDSEAIRNPPSETLLRQVAEGYEGTATKDFGDALAQNASATKKRIIEGARKKLDKVRADKRRGHPRRHEGFDDRWDAMTREEQMALGSNKRSVWSVATRPFAGAHFATFPPALIEPMILAGSTPGDWVLDPFSGAGTTLAVARSHGRNGVGVEINAEYCAIAMDRVGSDLVELECA